MPNTTSKKTKNKKNPKNTSRVKTTAQPLRALPEHRLNPPPEVPPTLELHEYLDTLIKIAEQKLTKNKNRIRVTRHGKSLQYYFITQKGDTNGKYIPKEKHKIAQEILYVEYCKKLHTLLKEKIKILTCFEKEFCSIHKQIEQAYTAISETRRNLFLPLIKSSEQYQKEWQEIKFTPKNFSIETPEIYTSQGLRVRSKSEVIIAETLYKNKIPFRYEYPVEIKQSDGSSTTWHPDFYCLNSRTKKEIIFEHFGIMDNPIYAEKTVKKICTYISNKIYPGEKFIFTMETTTQPLNAIQVEFLIKNFLK